MSDYKRGDEVKPIESNKVRIEFYVRHPETERFVSFGYDVSLGDVDDFFKRAGETVKVAFLGGVSMTALSFTRSCQNKISAIKLVRQITGSGLKEAKDAVESSMLTGAIAVRFETAEASARAQELFDSRVATSLIWQNDFKFEPERTSGSFTLLSPANHQF